MAMNTFGRIFRITSFGESHGKAIGGIIDGIPAGFKININEIQSELNRRRPGQSDIVSTRNETDKLHILSGIFEGKTLGTPIGFYIENTNHNSNDYSNLATAYRPSHADFTYDKKYGIRDYRGGGRSSARETISRVVAGAIAKQILKHKFNIDIFAYTSQVGNIKSTKYYSTLSREDIEKSIIRCPDNDVAEKMESLIREIKADGDTIGGIVTCVIKNVPVGIGEPVFGKLHARLADAMLSINAAKGFDYGMGFDGIGYRGSEMIDQFISDNGKIRTATNHSGGIQGGISNGEDIYMRVAFKPTATLLKNVQTVDCETNEISLKAKGRHDACVVPRAVPIVEAMAAIVILDNILLSQTNRF